MIENNVQLLDERDKTIIKSHDEVIVKKNK